MRRANSEYVCMYVCLKHPSMHVCLKSLRGYVCLTPVNVYVCLGCLSMYVCLQACLYGCMFETLNNHPGVGSDSSRKCSVFERQCNFLRFVRGGTSGAPKHTCINTLIQLWIYNWYFWSRTCLKPSSLYVCLETHSVYLLFTGCPIP